MPCWRIYYDNGSTFSDVEGTPEDAPAGGVQVIVQVDRSPHPQNVGTLILHGFDVYAWSDAAREWYGTDAGGYQMHRVLGSVRLAPLYGSWAPSAVWYEILARATADPDFPLKSGRVKREKPGMGAV